jgi:hypothetical protein
MQWKADAEACAARNFRCIAQPSEHSQPPLIRRDRLSRRSISLRIADGRPKRVRRTCKQCRVFRVQLRPVQGYLATAHVTFGSMLS